MSKSLIDRVLAAKAEAESPFATQISNGGSHDPSQQAAILIAQVQAIMAGTVTPVAETAPMKRFTLAALALFAFVCSAQAQVLGPSVTTVSVGASAIIGALPSNPSRKAVTICNGSATLIVTFTTGTVTPVSLTTGFVLQTGNVVASCFTMGSPGQSTPGGVGAQINVIANGAGPTNVTFFEYF